MGKDSTKNLVIQSIFKQIFRLIPGEKFDEPVIQCGSDRYYKGFFSWEQLITTLIGIFSGCDSMGEVCDGMRVLSGKLYFTRCNFVSCSAVQKIGNSRIKVCAGYDKKKH
jgi:hypothetical protein